MDWRACAKQLWPDLRSYAAICLEALRQTMQNTLQYTETCNRMHCLSPDPAQVERECTQSLNCLSYSGSCHNNSNNNNHRAMFAKYWGLSLQPESVTIACLVRTGEGSVLVRCYYTEWSRKKVQYLGRWLYRSWEEKKFRCTCVWCWVPR